MARGQLLAALLVVLASVGALAAPAVTADGTASSAAELEFGDAPDPSYPTDAKSDGARHLDVTNVSLGTDVSTETAPRSTDTGDDGVTWVDDDTIEVQVTSVYANREYEVNVLVDRDTDGGWEAGDWVVRNATGVTEGDGEFVLRFDLPVSRCDYAGDGTWMRVTVTDGPVDGYNGTGEFAVGETEDYRLNGTGCEYDFGDAPDPTYPTDAKSDGARHRNTSVGRLGDRASTESAPRSTDTADDGLSWVDDDTVRVEATSNYANRELTVNVLIDRDVDGHWNDSGDWVVRNATGTTDGAGELAFEFDLPVSRCDYADDPTWMRVTLADRPIDEYAGHGEYDVGETEDYRLNGSECAGPEPASDVRLNKTANVSTGRQGDRITYTLNVANDGPNSTEVEVADDLPACMDVVSASGPGTYDAGSHTWTLRLDPGQSEALELTAEVDCGPGEVTNNGTAVAVESDPDPSDNQDSATVAVMEPSRSCTEPPSDLVSWWPLDEESGSVAHDVAGGNDGTHVNGPSPAPGMVDGGLHFDRSGDHVEVPDSSSLDVDDDLTIDAWVRSDSGTPKIQYIVDKRDSLDGSGYFLRLNYYQRGVGFGGKAALHTAKSLPPPGNWVHVAGTFNQTSNKTYIKIYVNGSLVYSTSLHDVGTLTANDHPLRIGKELDGGNQFNGTIDEVEIHDRALDASEIRAIYAAGSAGKCKEVRRADVVLDKRVNDSSALSGRDVTYTLEVTNDGPNATRAEVVDDLPACVDVQSTSGPGTYDGTTWTVRLAPGENATLELLATVDCPPGSTVENVANATGNVTDLDPADNRANATVGVAEVADLALDKQANVSAVRQGKEVTYTLVVENGGPNATRAEVLDDLPSCMTVESATGPGSYDPSTHAWVVGLQPGQTAELELVVSATCSVGILTNTANATANASDPNVADNRDDATVTVLTSDEGTIEFGDAPDPPYNSVVSGRMRGNSSRFPGPYAYPRIDNDTHLYHGSYLGENVSYEGAPNLVNEDEFDDGFVANETTSTTLTVTAGYDYPRTTPPGVLGNPLYINLFVDLNGDGDWTDAGEWVIQDHAVTVPPGGTKTVSFNVTPAVTAYLNGSTTGGYTRLMIRPAKYGVYNDGAGRPNQRRWFTEMPFGEIEDYTQDEMTEIVRTRSFDVPNWPGVPGFTGIQVLIALIAVVVYVHRRR